MEAEGGRVTQPEFLTKLYDVVDDEATNEIVEWRECNSGFIINDPEEFFKSLLPEHFKVRKFDSFRRQLNYYGFKKISRDNLEYANDGFRRGQRHLLNSIKRRTPAAAEFQRVPPPSVEAKKTLTDLETFLDNLLQKIIDAGKHAQLLQQILSPRAAVNEQSGSSSQDKKRKLPYQNEKSSAPDKKAERSNNVHIGSSSGAKLPEFSPHIAAALIEGYLINDNMRSPSIKISGQPLPEAIPISSVMAHNALFSKEGISAPVPEKNSYFQELDDIHSLQYTAFRKYVISRVISRLFGEDSDESS